MLSQSEQQPPRTPNISGGGLAQAEGELVAVVAELAAALLQLRKDRLLDHLAAAESPVSGAALRIANGTSTAPPQAALARQHGGAAGPDCGAGSSDRSSAGAAGPRAGTQGGSTVRIGAAVLRTMPPAHSCCADNANLSAACHLARGRLVISYQ